ncbi:hypothetical protein L9F63_000447, partial [Diploptera punctata]
IRQVVVAPLNGNQVKPIFGLPWSLCPMIFQFLLTAIRSRRVKKYSLSYLHLLVVLFGFVTAHRPVSEHKRGK